MRGKNARFQYAIIDGKQRLHTIWAFLDGATSLASDFSPAAPEGRSEIGLARKFAEPPGDWQELFKSKALDTVLVQNAAEEDIEELFSRLNNGEPLNAAEKRNALGGDMCQVVREVSSLPFFGSRLPFGSRRYEHLELAAKLLLIEVAEESGGDVFVDLKKKFLDKLVTDRRSMSTAAKSGMIRRVDEHLKVLQRVFREKDPLLAKQAYAPMYYLFMKVIARNYAHPALFTRVHEFLEKFHAQRAQNLELPEDQRDPVLLDFGRLLQQGTNDRTSLQTRVSILTRHFLQEYPDTEIRDSKRAFTDEERLAIWVLGGKKCGECGRALEEVSEMEADHKLQWAHGGPTTLDNGRSLCSDCNRALAQRVE